MIILNIILVIIGVVCIIFSFSTLYAIKNRKYNHIQLIDNKYDTRMIIMNGKLESRK